MTRLPRTSSLVLGLTSLFVLAPLACSAPGSSDSDDGGAGSPAASGGAPSASGGAGQGSGGLLSSGGASGGGTDAGSGGSGELPLDVTCTGTEILCEDFEDAAAGATPGSPWLTRDSSCQYGSFGLEVTGERAHLGSQSLHVTNASYAQCRLAAPIGAHDEFWVRAFVYWSPETDFSNREVLDIDLIPSSGLGKDDPAVRFGHRSKEPCTASAGPQITIIGLAGGEQTGCSTTRLIPQGEWYCFEAHVTQRSNVVVRTYIEGEALSYTSSGKPITDTIETPSAPSEKLDHIRLGMFSTNSGMSGDLWIDDLAIAATRLGCGTR